jgi:hypothetical protein
MDFGKLQADVVKNTYKHIDNRAARDYTVYGNIAINTKRYIPITYKNATIYLVPVGVNMLSHYLQTISDKVSPHFDSLNDSKELRDTGITIDFAKAKLRKLETKDDVATPIWVDTKLLKPFGKDVKFYYSKNAINTVYVRDGSGELLGLVLRVKLSEPVEYNI